jgi:hypothetical protein
MAAWEAWGVRGNALGMRGESQWWGVRGDVWEVGSGLEWEWLRGNAWECVGMRWECVGTPSPAPPNGEYLPKPPVDPL